MPRAKPPTNFALSHYLPQALQVQAAPPVRLPVGRAAVAFVGRPADRRAFALSPARQPVARLCQATGCASNGLRFPAARSTEGIVRPRKHALTRQATTARRKPVSRRPQESGVAWENRNYRNWPAKFSTAIWLDDPGERISVEYRDKNRQCDGAAQRQAANSEGNPQGAPDWLAGYKFRLRSR